MKTILVLTDFSLPAEYAAEYAVDMARAIHANVLLGHAIEVAVPAGMESPVPLSVEDYSQIKEMTMKELEVLRARLENTLALKDGFRPTISVTVDFGNPDQVAGHITEEQEISLILAGSHHVTFFQKFLFGSTTHSLLDHVNCPVLLIPEGKLFKKLKKMVYATDLTFDNREVVDWLAELAKPFNSEIEVRHIYKEANDNSRGVEESSTILKLVAEHAKNTDIHFRQTPGRDIQKSLLEMCRMNKTDILAVVHKQYPFPESLYHKSVSMKLADAAEVPLLVFPNSFCR